MVATSGRAARRVKRTHKRMMYTEEPFLQDARSVRGNASVLVGSCRILCGHVLRLYVHSCKIRPVWECDGVDAWQARGPMGRGRINCHHTRYSGDYK